MRAQAAVGLVLMLLLITLCGCTSRRENTEAGSLPDFDALWDYNHPDSTEAAFRSLLPLAGQSGDQSYRAQLLTQIARAQGLQMKFAEAHRTLDSAETMLSDGMVIPRLRCMLERGRVYNSAGQPDSARPYFLKTWDLAGSTGEDFYAVDAAHMMAIIEPPQEQVIWAEKAMHAAEASQEERAKRWLGSLYNNTGWTYHNLGEYEKALDMFEKSLAWNREYGGEERVRIARWTIARTYRSLGRVEEALAMQKGLGEEIASKGLEPDGYVFEEIGECLLLLGRADEAGGYFARAYDLLSQDPWLVKNEAARLERLRALSD
jgi:tetratricopeptide (TPR) repeat protein